MNKLRLTAAQALLRFLDKQYISVDGKETKFFRGVMGIFGHGNVTGLGEALENDSGELLYIQGKNEQDNHGFQCIHNLQWGYGSKGFGNEFRYRSEF